MAVHDLAIMGAGPGGYVAAIRAAQLGMDVVIIERDTVGGICLNLGCIPSKALLRNAEVLSLIRHADRFGIEVTGVKADYAQAVARSRKVVDKLTRGVSSLLKKNKVELIQGSASLVDTHTIAVGDQRIKSRHIIVATGARPRSLPGLEVDGALVVTYREAILQADIPRDAVIVGGGAIGVEFASIYGAYGANVTIVEYESSIMPREDEEISKLLTRALERRGITIHSGAKVTGLDRSGTDGATVAVETHSGTMALHADRVLVAAGIQANTEGLGLEQVGVTLNRGYVKVDDELRANADGIYAIGDVIGIMPLAHVAQAQGVYLAERLAGHEAYPLDYRSMPSATYSTPQVASFGITEQEAKAQGIPHKIGRFPMSANGKALALDETEGMAKVVVAADTGEILGAHLIGQEVTEMLGELSLARIMEGTNLEVGAVVNAHPTISEIVKEAALAADGRAIHI
jgi:dihydrolipoamide dehydrogenase